MESIAERIRENKPNITDSSIKTYTSIVTNLAKKMNVDPKFFIKNPQKTLEFLEDRSPNNRKTTLAALIVYIGDDQTKGSGALEKYRERMMSDISVYNDEMKKQERSTKDAENWIDWSNVQKMYSNHFKDYNKLLKRENLNKYETQRLIELILLSIYILIPPRRSEDYCQFKLHNIDKEKDNYLDNNQFVFNTYKTSKKYGRQNVKVPQKLVNLVNSLKSRDDWGDYLLKDSHGKKFTPAKITSYLNKIFGKKVSSSMLRKSYLTSKYKNIPALQSILQTGNDMGNSFEVQLSNYVKKDIKQKKDASDKTTKETRTK